MQLNRNIFRLFKFILTGCLLMFFTTWVSGQEADVTKDTLKVKSLLTRGEAIYIEDPDSAALLFSEVKAFCEKQLKKYSGDTGKDAKALRFFYSTEMADACYNIGYLSLDKGDVLKGLDFYHQSLKIRENTFSPVDNTTDQHGIAQTLNDIGVIYLNQEDSEEALKYYNRSFKIRQAIGDKSGMAQSLNNIGVVYKNQKLAARALENYRKALAMQEEVSEKEGLAYTLNNIAAIYKESGDPECSGTALECELAGCEKALSFLQRGLKIQEEIGEKAGIAYSKNNIASVLFKLKRNKEALEYAKESMALSMELGYPNNISRSSQTLSKLYAQSGDYKNAYEMQVLFKQMADSINNENGRKASIKKEFQYVYEKKAAADSVKSMEERKVFAAQMEKEKTQRTALYLGIILIAIFSAFMYNRFRITRKQKSIIEFQKAEVEQKKIQVEKQKEIIEEKNKDITDSINYAKRIQQAKLPQLEDLYASLPQSFVLFKPKDIVSGDFYFYYKSSELIFIAAADCTGHGVPGALMSMVGSEQLNDAVKQSKDTAEILKLVNRGMKASLRQSADENSTRDGMDIALCSINLKDGSVSYSGANRPIWIIRKGQAELEEIKATKKAIGGLTEDGQHFEAHNLKLNEGDTFYLSTDGYSDTFSGKNNKKLTTKKFKQLLLDICDKSMQQQKSHLENFIEDWKADAQQVDDILVIGVRL